jgi:hypothetical protein
MSDAILPDYPSAAIFRTTTKLLLAEGSTSTAILPITTSDIVGQRNKIGGITFGASLIVTYALFMVFLTCLGRRMAAKNRKMLLFDVPDSVIRSLRKLENLTLSLFERQVKQMTLDSFFKKE